MSEKNTTDLKSQLDTLKSENIEKQDKMLESILDREQKLSEQVEIFEKQSKEQFDQSMKQLDSHVNNLQNVNQSSSEKLEQ